MKPENLINWGELSRLLAGSRSVITKKRIGKKHEKTIKDYFETWLNNNEDVGYERLP